VAARWLLTAHLLLCPLVFTTLTAEAFEPNKEGLLTLTTVLLAAMGLAAAGPSGILRALRNRVDLLTLGFILLVASAAVSTLTSISPRISWRGTAESPAGLRTLLGYLILFLAARSISLSAADARRLLGGAVIAAFFAAGYGLVQAAGVDPLVWDNTSAFANHDRPFGTLGHATHLATYLVMTLPFTVYFALEAGRRRAWLALAALAATGAMSVAAILLSLSRAAWLAAGVSLPVCLILRRRRAQQDSDTTQKKASLRILRVLVGLSLVSCLLSPCLLFCLSGTFRASLAERVHHLGDASGRRFVWSAAWDLFRDRPYLGWGPNTLHLVFGRHRPAGYALVEWNTTPARAHNILLHVLATQGIVGGAALLVLLVGLARAALGAWRRAATADRAFVAAVIASALAFVLAGVFGFSVIACCSLFAVSAGLLSTWAASPKAVFVALARAPRAPLVVGYSAVAAGTAALVLTQVVYPLAAARACRLGDRVSLQDPAAARHDYEQAAAWDVGDDRFRVRLADVSLRLSRQASVEAALARELACAREEIERALALVPVDPYHHGNRARVLSEQARYGLASSTTALAAWDEALALDPNNACFLAEAARTALLLEDRPRFQAWADRCLELYPRFAPPVALQGAAALRDGRFAEAVERLHQALHGDWHDDLEGADHAQATLAAAYLGLNAYWQARYHAREVVQRRPEWTTAHFLLAQSLEGEGSFSEAASQYRQALTLDPRHAPSLAALRQLEKHTNPSPTQP
jgi:O-antigen ligase/tetratricopeptide (TPR) repeat protein